MVQNTKGNGSINGGMDRVSSLGRMAMYTRAGLSRTSERVLASSRSGTVMCMKEIGLMASSMVKVR